jgi:hypothetical protein
MTIVATKVSSEVTPTIPAADTTSLDAINPGGPGQTRTGGWPPISNDGVLVAGAAGGGLVPGRPNPTPSAVVKTWTNTIIPPLSGGNPTNQIRPAPTGSAVINAPTLGQGQRSSGPLSTVFGQGSKMINAPEVPQFTKPAETTLATVNSALTQGRLNQFAALDKNQKMLARTMLAAAVDVLDKGQLTPQAFSEVVGLVLKAAQETKFAAPVTPAKPNTSRTIPGQVEIVPNLAQRPGAITTNEIVPDLAPRPGGLDATKTETGNPTTQRALPGINPTTQRALPPQIESKVEANRQLQVRLNEVASSRPEAIKNIVASTSAFETVVADAQSAAELSTKTVDIDGQSYSLDITKLSTENIARLDKVLADPVTRADFSRGVYGTKEIAEIGTALKNQIVQWSATANKAEGKIYLAAQENPKKPGTYTDYIVQVQDGSQASDSLITEFGEKMWAGYPVIHRIDQENLTPKALTDEDIRPAAPNQLLIIAYPVTGSGAATATVRIRNPGDKAPLGYTADLTSTMKGGGGLILKAAVKEIADAGLPGATFTAYAGRGEPRRDGTVERFPGNAEPVVPSNSELIHTGLTNTGMSNPPPNDVLIEIFNGNSADLGFYMKNPLGGNSAGFGQTNFNGLKPEVVSYQLAPTTGPTNNINQTTRFALIVPVKEDSRTTLYTGALTVLGPGAGEPNPVFVRPRAPEIYPKPEIPPADPPPGADTSNPDPNTLTPQSQTEIEKQDNFFF